MKKYQKGGVIKKLKSKVKSKAKQVGKNVKSKLANFVDKQRAEQQSTARYKQRKSIGYYKNSNKKQYGGAAEPTRPARRTRPQSPENFMNNRTPELPPKRTRPSRVTSPRVDGKIAGSIRRPIKSGPVRSAPKTPIVSKSSGTKPNVNRSKERIGKREVSAYNKKMDYRKSTNDPNMKKIARNDKRLSRRQDKSIDAGVNVDYKSGRVSYKKGGAMKSVPAGKKFNGLRSLPSGVRNKMGYAKYGSVVKGGSLRRSRKHL